MLDLGIANSGKNGMERGRKRKEEGGGTKGGEVMTAVTAVVTVTRFTESETFWRKGLLRIRVCIIAKTREQTPGLLVSFPRAISLWTSGQG